MKHTFGHFNWIQKGPREFRFLQILESSVVLLTAPHFFPSMNWPSVGACIHGCTIHVAVDDFEPRATVEGICYTFNGLNTLPRTTRGTGMRPPPLFLISTSDNSTCEEINHVSVTFHCISL